MLYSNEPVPLIVNVIVYVFVAFSIVGVKLIIALIKYCLKLYEYPPPDPWLPVIVVVLVNGRVAFSVTVGFMNKDSFLFTWHVIEFIVCVTLYVAVVNDPLAVEAIGQQMLIVSE